MSSSDFSYVELAAGQAVMSRINPGFNLVEAMKKRAAVSLGKLARFPSLLITADTIEPQGSFAEAQAQYLQPDPAQVARLVQVPHPPSLLACPPVAGPLTRPSALHLGTHAFSCLHPGVQPGMHACIHMRAHACACFC